MKKLFECCYQIELFFNWEFLEFCPYGIFDGVFILWCLWSRPYKVLFRMKEKRLCKMLWSACICYFALFYNLQYESWHLCKLEVPASALQEVSGLHSVTCVLTGTVHSLTIFYCETFWVWKSRKKKARPIDQVTSGATGLLWLRLPVMVTACVCSSCPRPQGSQPLGTPVTD